MEKPRVFISHITQEKKLAEIIKNQLQNDFLDMLEVFVSSDQVSISVGSKWLNDIDNALKNAQIEIIICSRESVKRPWVNFEAGAGWVKGIPVIPICHTGMRLIDLPIPLNMLQGIEAKNSESWQGIYDLLSKKLSSRKPIVDLSSFIDLISNFEKEYGLITEVSSAIHNIIEIIPDLEQIFRKNPKSDLIGGDITDISLDKMKPHLDILKAKRIIDYAVGSNKMVFGVSGGGGNMVEVNIKVLPEYEALRNTIFK
jgi:TIR domain